MDGDSPERVEQGHAGWLSLAVHELRSPASVVSGYLRMLQHEAPTGLTARHLKMITEADASFERIVALIDQMSELERMDSARVVLRQDTFDLFAVIGDAARETTEAADRHVRLIARGDESGAMFLGDRQRVRTAVTSVLRAVLREQLDDQQVIVDRVRADEGRAAAALVVVAHEQDLERAKQARRAPFDDQRGGLGLALPIARRVLERHGGQIWSPMAEGGDAAARSAILFSLPLT